MAKAWAEPFNFSNNTDTIEKIPERGHIVAHQSITEALFTITQEDIESVANIALHPTMLEFIIKQDAVFTKGITSFVQTGKSNAHTRSLTAVMHKVYTSLVKQPGQKLWRGGRMPIQVGGKWYTKAVEFLVSITVIRFKGVNVILAEIPHAQPTIMAKEDLYRKLIEEFDAKIQSRIQRDLLKQSLEVQQDMNNILRNFTSSRNRREVKQT